MARLTCRPAWRNWYSPYGVKVLSEFIKGANLKQVSGKELNLGGIQAIEGTKLLEFNLSVASVVEFSECETVTCDAASVPKLEKLPSKWSKIPSKFSILQLKICIDPKKWEYAAFEVGQDS